MSASEAKRSETETPLHLYFLPSKFTTRYRVVVPSAGRIAAASPTLSLRLCPSLFLSLCSIHVHAYVSANPKRETSDSCERPPQRRRLRLRFRFRLVLTGRSATTGRRLIHHCLDGLRHEKRYRGARRAVKNTRKRSTGGDPGGGGLIFVCACTPRSRAPSIHSAALYVVRSTCVPGARERFM